MESNGKTAAPPPCGQTEESIKANLHELQRWRNVTLDREDRIRALKREVNTLLTRQGRPPRYASEAAPAERAPAGT